MTTDPTPEPTEPDDPAAHALARHIADHPVGTIQAAFRYLNAPVAAELHEDAGPAPAPVTDPAELRDRIATALVRYDWNAGLSGRVTPSEHHYGEADAVLAVLPSAADWDALVHEAARLRREGATLHARAEEIDGRVAALQQAVLVLPATADRAADILRRTEAYLSAMHGSVARHDNLGEGLGCAGCELRDQIRAELRRVPAEEPQTEGEQSAPVDEARQDGTGPVKKSTRRYAEKLRGNPSSVVADGHTGWECDAGALLIVEASTPGPGKLGTHHGVIYACARHRDASVERITDAGYQVDPRPAPPGHRHSPWPCGHVTAHDTKALAALTGRGEA
ncbi:hypothetical protein ACIOKD_14365 [Streptomyces sp. NPDC087844]|uniref:hypothetical protein n=1 Tax=Streptomyces sp. NPDC087844 TaxID=3365805 RepID=UPI0037F29199